MSVSEEAERLLTSEPLTAFLATCREARPHVAPVWYRYADGTVEIATSGRKLRNVRENPRVSLSVQKADAGLPEWTVTLFGTATIVEDAKETSRAVGRINQKYGVEEDAWIQNTLVRIDVGSASVRTY